MADNEKEEVIHVHSISDLCKQTFIEKDTMTRTLWGIAVVCITLCGASIAWALSVNTSISALEVKTAYQEQKLHQLDELINQKLDILIKRAEESDRLRRQNAR